MKKHVFHHLTIPALLSCLFFAPLSLATIVEFQTSEGDFQVNLYDETTPATVANFLAYVNGASYNGTVIHRSIPNFIIQGGGFVYQDLGEGKDPLVAIETDEPVINEPLYSNVTNTIAMAKIGGAVNSATSQWFINTVDNSAHLDRQNGGFTVFGEVIGDGMTVVNNISAIATCQDIPMVDFTSTDCQQDVMPIADNFVTIYQVVIFDPTVDSAADLTPTPSSSSGGSSGGSLAFFSLVSLVLVRFRPFFHR